MASNPAVKEAVQDLNMKVQVSLMDILSQAYGEGFVKALQDVQYKEPPDIKKKDTQAMLEATERLVAPIRDYNDALAEKVSEIISEGFESGLDQFEVAANLRSRIPDILNNEPVTIQREGKRPVSFTAEAYADLVADTVPYAVRNAGYVSGLEAGGADGWVSVAAGDERMCEECGDKNGQIYQFGDPLPPYHNHCRCRPIAYYKEKEPGEEQLAKGTEEKGPEKSPIGDKERIQRVIDALTKGTPVSKDLAAPGLEVYRPVLETKSLEYESSPTFQDIGNGKLDAVLAPQKGSEDLVIKSICKEQKFDKPPISVTKDEMDAIVKDGHLELFRGDSRPDAISSFAKDDVYYGKGIFGSGVYTAVNKPQVGAIMEAETYARMYAEKNGQVLRMALDKGAKIARWDELVEASQKEASDTLFKFIKLGEELSKQGKTEELALLEKKYAALKQIWADTGRYGVYKGYDAILVPVNSEGNGVRDYMIVLNRAAVYLQVGV